MGSGTVVCPTVSGTFWRHHPNHFNHFNHFDLGPIYLYNYFSIKYIKMVHLAKVSKGSEVPSTQAMPSDQVEDAASFTVYGSHFSTERLPHDQIPEAEMPPGIAYRLIKDELSLDGNPLLK